MAELEVLLALWRETRNPEVADVIDRVSAPLAAREAPIRAVGSQSAKAAWHAAVAKARPEMLPRLLEALPDGLDRVLRLRALLALPPDPRIGTFIKAWLEAPPIVGKNRRSFFAGVFELITHVGDVRLLPVVTRLAGRRSEAVNRFGLSNYKTFAALVAPLNAIRPAPLDADAKALLARAVDAKPPPSLDPAELFAAVYANPDDNDARAVLADLLSERGDPRGEFIALQLARHESGKPPSPQERKLEQAWGRTWLGPLEPFAHKAGVEFERGFVTRLRFMGGSGNATAGAPEWSTVTAIDATTASQLVGGSIGLLTGPPLKSLREVTGLAHDDLLAILAKFGEVPWPSFGLRLFHWQPLLTALAPFRGRPLAKVKSLRIASAHRGGFALAVPPIVELLAMWPSIEEVALMVRTDEAALVAHEACQRLRRITLQAGSKTTVHER